MFTASLKLHGFISRYLNTYKKYADLLNNKAEQEVSAFLKERHSLQAFQAVSSVG
jgi:dynein heavy chain